MSGTTAPGTATSERSERSERADLLDTLTKSRFFLRFTARDLTDDQARRPEPVSGLCVGGLIKHVTRVEHAWAEFAQGRPGGLTGEAETDPQAHQNSFVMAPEESMAGLLERYEQVAARTDGLVATLDLDESHPLPQAPWFEPGARWTTRRVLLHIIAETAQHAGHADLVREGIDGAKSMG